MRAVRIFVDLFWFACGLVWASYQRARGRIHYYGPHFVRDVWRLVRVARARG